MKKAVLIYGICGGLLIAALRVAEYRFLVAYAIEKARASGATQQAIDQTAARMKTFKGLYDRPLINAAITFIEPLPVGLLVALVSAAVLRRKG